jgi:anthranilate synthase/aminodeoxychorismate synthase-like glutamine amidotransferase
MILIDNYDSFTYNVVQYLRELGAEPKIVKNDEITVAELKKLDFTSIIISPGPKNPDEAGISLEVIEEFHKSKKILGICLGHQCIAQYFGAKIIKDKEPTHGKVSKIYFEKDPLFNGLEQGFNATRYHSLIVDTKTLPNCIIPIAFTKTDVVGLESPTYFSDSGTKVDNSKRPNYPSRFTPHFSLLMALKHKDYQTYGVQFHPEAILTEGGKLLLSNFICLS